jgi:hypothetical protein
MHEQSFPPTYRRNSFRVKWPSFLLFFATFADTLRNALFVYGTASLEMQINI